MTRYNQDMLSSTKQASSLRALARHSSSSKGHRVFQAQAQDCPQCLPAASRTGPLRARPGHCLHHPCAAEIARSRIRPGPELLRHLRCHLQHAIQHRLQIGDRLPRAWRYLAADEPIPSRTWLRPQRNVIAKLKLLHLPFTGARTWSAKVRCCLGSGGFVVVDNLLDHPL